MKVTRIAYGHHLNAGKYEKLAEQARRLGLVRSTAWNQFGSITGAGVSDRAILDRWMADGAAELFSTPANAWKETVRDRLPCPHGGGVVWDADHAAAINILERDGDPDISVGTPHRRAKQIIRQRDRQRSRLPDQESDTAGQCRCERRKIRTRSTMIKA